MVNKKRKEWIKSQKYKQNSYKCTKDKFKEEK